MTFENHLKMSICNPFIYNYIIFIRNNVNQYLIVPFFTIRLDLVRSIGDIFDE
jgi:hypothetical protein